jgi:hypothetical protein
MYDAGSGPDEGAASARQRYERYVEGTATLNNERARCGWFVGRDFSGGFTNPATPNYVCSKKAPSFLSMQYAAPAPARGPAPAIAPVFSTLVSKPVAAVSALSPVAKVALAAGAVAGLYLLIRKA